MRNFIGLLIVFSAPFAHANVLECTDSQGGFIADLTLNADGSARFDGNGFAGIGSYKIQYGGCPTRLCGSWTVQALFGKMIHSPSNHTHHMSVWLDADAIFTHGSVGIYEDDGSAPQVIAIQCKDQTQ